MSNESNQPTDWRTAVKPKSDNRPEKLEVDIGAWKIELLAEPKAYTTNYGNREGVSLHILVNATHHDEDTVHLGKTWVIYSAKIQRALAEYETLTGLIVRFDLIKIGDNAKDIRYTNITVESQDKIPKTTDKSKKSKKE